MLLIAPTAYHRILFRLGDKEHLVNVANRLTLAGVTCVALSMVGAVLLVTDLLFSAVAVVVGATALAALGCAFFWCLAPLLRRAQVQTIVGATTVHAPRLADPASGPGQQRPRSHANDLA